jgi:hypothetical protein
MNPNPTHQKKVYRQWCEQLSSASAQICTVVEIVLRNRKWERQLEYLRIHLRDE